MQKSPVLSALFVLSTACGPSLGPHASTRPPLATQWLDRAKTSYRAGDFDDAHESARQALVAAPSDSEIRELAARIALVRLELTDALRLTDGLESSAAHGIRGRAYWFSGDIEHAADELDAMLADPAVKDPWAREVASLARRGAGRHPFEMEGGLVAAVEMPRQIDRVPLGAANVVPCELDGERILALVATGSSEVLLDSNSRHEPAWVDLRFDRIEVKDVPALVQDLSTVTRQLGVPIKALLGAQLLRHAHVTFDRRGDQFVVRRQDPSPPPDASRIPLYYLRGGGMILHAMVTERNESPLPLLVDSARPFPLLLQDGAWQKAGVDVRSLTVVPEAPTLKRGMVPVLRVGGFDLAKMPALEGADMSDITTGIDVDLAGVVGADLLAFFRVTLADEGRFMWFEPDPTLVGPVEGAPGAKPVPAAAATPTPPSPSSTPPSRPPHP
ncbi:MAG TPA: tetratricopeptide repeat protein [Polyangiaceae bacterium]|nr:tetratricopeptide repeat protein [Polyangiaceae bacterium]